MSASLLRLSASRSVVSSANRSFSGISSARAAHKEFSLPRDIPLQAPLAEDKISQIGNGLRLITHETFGPTSSLTLAVPAGSRYEKDQPGIASFLKNFAFRNTKTQSPLKIIRECELRGVQLSTNLCRSLLTFNAEFLRDDLSFVTELFSDVLYNTKFNHWELKSVSSAVADEITGLHQCPTTLALETARKAAFRNGIGNSFVAPVGVKYSIDQIKSFASKNAVVGPRSALVGVGVNHAELSELSELHFSAASGSSSPVAASKYYGAEQRVASAAGNAFFYGFQGAAHQTKDFAVLEVLRAFLGEIRVGPHGPGASLLARQKPKAYLKTYNLGHEDAGLFGVLSTSKNTADISESIKKSLAVLQEISKGMHSEELIRAVNQAKFASLSNLETREGRIQHMTKQVFSQSLSDIASLIDSVSFDEIVGVVKRMGQSTPTVVAVGDTHTLPYIDTLI